MENNFKPEDKLMALSWKQPYAELMLHGKIETRTWNTKYRGWVLICASKQGYRFNQINLISGDRHLVRMTNLLGRNFDHFLNNYKSGVAIAIGKLVDCRPMKESDEDRCFVDDHTDLFCHVYENVQAIKPFPWKGTQGWKEVSMELKKQIEFL